MDQTSDGAKPSSNQIGGYEYDAHKASSNELNLYNAKFSSSSASSSCSTLSSPNSFQINYQNSYNYHAANQQNYAYSSANEYYISSSNQVDSLKEEQLEDEEQSAYLDHLNQHNDDNSDRARANSKSKDVKKYFSTTSTVLFDYYNCKSEILSILIFLCSS